MVVQQYQQLILKAPFITAADNILILFFRVNKTDISCELSAWQTIHMKCQVLSLKKNMRMSSAASLLGALKVKTRYIPWQKVSTCAFSTLGRFENLLPYQDGTVEMFEDQFHHCLDRGIHSSTCLKGPPKEVKETAFYFSHKQYLAGLFLTICRLKHFFRVKP